MSYVNWWSYSGREDDDCDGEDDDDDIDADEDDDEDADDDADDEKEVRMSRNPGIQQPQPEGIWGKHDPLHLRFPDAKPLRIYCP